MRAKTLCLRLLAVASLAAVQPHWSGCTEAHVSADAPLPADAVVNGDTTADAGPAGTATSDTAKRTTDGESGVAIPDSSSGQLPDTTAENDSNAPADGSTDGTLSDTESGDARGGDSLDTGPAVPDGSMWDLESEADVQDTSVVEDATTDSSFDVMVGDATAADDGGADVAALLGCDGTVASGALGPQGFEQCAGLPKVAPEELPALTPIPLSCSPAPEVPATFSKSYSFKSWLIKSDGYGGWDYPPVIGIQRLLAKDDDTVWFAGLGDKDAPFDYEKPYPYKVIVAAVDRDNGLVWARQPEPSGKYSSLWALVGNPDGGAVLTGVRDDEFSALWTIPEAPDEPAMELAPDYGYLPEVAVARDGNTLVVCGRANLKDPCLRFTAAELFLDGAVGHVLEGGGPNYTANYQPGLVPLAPCGYGLVTRGTPVGNFAQPVVVRLDDQLEVVGLWRWNLPSMNTVVVGETLAQPLDGDLLLAVNPTIAAPVDVYRIDGNSGEILWRTQVIAPEGHTSSLDGFTVLPDGRSVVSTLTHVDKPEPPDEEFAMLSVLSPDGCVLVHYTFKGVKTDWDLDLKYLQKVVALSNTRVAAVTLGFGNGRSELVFIDLPPVP